MGVKSGDRNAILFWREAPRQRLYRSNSKPADAILAVGPAPPWAERCQSGALISAGFVEGPCRGGRLAETPR